MRLVDLDSDTNESAESTAEEVACFKFEKKLPDSEDPLMWWKMKEHRFLRLALLAKNVLCVPTTYWCRFVYRSAGYIVKKNVFHLIHIVNMLICLQDCCR